MINPALALFAIEAGVRLGRKLNQVLVDETAERPLLLPLGDLIGNVTEADALRFFTVEQPDLIKPGGPCHALRDNRPRLIEVYRAMRGIESAATLPPGDFLQQRRHWIIQLSALDQFDHSFQAHHPARRILGTVVEIGIDYFIAHPEAMGRDSNARRIIHAFLSGLNESDFSESTSRQVLGDLLASALQLGEHFPSLAEDESRLAILLGGISGAVADDIAQAVRNENEVARHQLFRRIGCSLIRGTATAFNNEIALFLPHASPTRLLVQSTLSQVLHGIRDHESLFSNETLELIIQSTLRATAENAEFLIHHKILQDLIHNTATVLADRQWDKIFSTATAGPVLCVVLDVLHDNMETLLEPDHPREQWLVQALQAMAGSLSTRMAGGGNIQDLLSRRQVIDLSRLVLQQVAENPELLIGNADDSRKTVVAQVIASVARALGNEPTLLTNGEGVIALTRLGLQVTLANVQAMIDLESANPTRNLLYQILRQITSTLARAEDPRGLVTRHVFLDIAQRILPLVSANLESLNSNPEIVGTAISVSLGLAQDAMAGRINGANLAALMEHLLRLALWDELALDDAAAVVRASRHFLHPTTTT